MTFENLNEFINDRSFPFLISPSLKLNSYLTPCLTASYNLTVTDRFTKKFKFSTHRTRLSLPGGCRSANNRTEEMSSEHTTGAFLANCTNLLQSRLHGHVLHKLCVPRAVRDRTTSTRHLREKRSFKKSPRSKEEIEKNTNHDYRKEHKVDAHLFL